MRALILSTLLINLSCAPENISSPLGVIVRKNDIIPLSQLPRDLINLQVLEKTKRFTVLLVTLLASDGNEKKVKTCSGSLLRETSPSGVHEYKVLTNYHCFTVEGGEAEEMAGGAVETLTPETCVQTKVYVNFPATAGRETMVLSCRAGSFRGDPRLDLALFTVDGRLPADQPTAKLWQGGDIPLERTVFVLHYPNVSETFMQKLPDSNIKAPIKMVTVNDCYYKGRFNEQQQLGSYNVAYWVKHTCDLLSGSSGSALLDLVTGDILAVNRGAVHMTKTVVQNNKTLVQKYSFNTGPEAKYLHTFLANEPLPEPADALKK